MHGAVREEKLSVTFIDYTESREKVTKSRQTDDRWSATEYGSRDDRGDCWSLSPNFARGPDDEIEFALLIFR